MLKLSIIVPVYKVEPYLRKCVDSLLFQDLSWDVYEIVLVDDGSPDRCPLICDEYAGKYQNVKVIHQNNGGLSRARNSGITVANGEYVQFVDSDDYLEPNVLKTLVNKMDESRLDVLRFNYQNVNEQSEIFEPNKAGKPFMDYQDKTCDGETFLTERLGFACYACQFIIRRSLLEDCLFHPGIYFEDTEWTPRLLLKSIRVSSTELVVYNYLIRQGSITKSIAESQKRKVIEDKLQSIDFLRQTRNKARDKRWFDGMIALTVISIIDHVAQSFYSERKVAIEALKAKKVFPLSFFHATDSNRLKVVIANISPSILLALFRMRRVKN